MCALRIAVTGTAGRLGGSIARACRAAGQEVAATLDRAPGADVSHVADLSADGRHTWASAFEGVDVVIHAAALPGPAREPPPTVDASLGAALEAAGVIGLEDAAPSELFGANIASTLNVLDAAARAGVRRVVLSSSAFAMGWSHDARAFSPARLPLRDGDAPRPRESYGLSKEVGDAVGAAYARACGLEVASLRFTNVVKRDAFRSLPWAYDARVPLVMWAWAHEDDVVDAHVAAAAADAARLFAEGDEATYAAFLVCAPSTRYAESTADLLAAHFSPAAPPRFEGSGNGSVLCGARAARALAPWKPRCWTAPRRGLASAAARAAAADPRLERVDVGGLPLDGGGALPGGATLAYRVYGDRSGPRVAVHPSSFGAVHAELAYNVPLLLEHADAVLVANMLGNGVSSSPSTCAAYPPVVTVDDQARALRRACDAAFGPGRTVDVAYGYSMGAMQALALARGGGVAAVVAVCGASGCSDYNRVFLDALGAALEGGDRTAALRAFALVYAGWGVSYDFYAERAWARLGFEDLDDFLERSYVAGFAGDDPDDLRAMLACWRAAAERPPGLEAIEARCLFLPCDTDASPGVRRFSRAVDPEIHEKSPSGRRTSERTRSSGARSRPSPARRSDPSARPSATARATPGATAWTRSGPSSAPR